MTRSIWIGFEPREFSAFAVAKHSIARRLTQPIPIRPVILADLQQHGLYTRPTTRSLGRLQDELSRRDGYNGEMSTEFAISRFLVPHLARSGWAMFTDCDVLARANIARLFDEVARTDFAVMCVKHDHRPSRETKMDGCAQTQYARKNWSSVMLFNCHHPANRALTLELINTAPGRDLHGFCWLKDEEIGELSPEWNFLVGHSDPAIEPKIVHFTDGIPTMPGFENVPYADEWRMEINACAR